MKLKYVNNWEHDEYYVGDARVVKLTEVKINGESYKVTSREETVPYSDMGHSYSSTSTHFFIKANVFGDMREFDLNEFAQKGIVEPVKFKTE